MRLKDKVTIVTGAASGFGEGIARLYAAEGAKVAVADINAAGAKSVAASIGSNAIAVTCDVTKRADIDALVQATRDAFGGRIDVVVNNAGWTHRTGRCWRSTRRPSTRSTHQRQEHLPHDPRDRAADAPAEGRRHPQRRFHRRHPAPPGPHLVQQFEGRGEPDEQVARGGTRPGQHPRQRDLPGAWASPGCSRSSWACRTRRKTARSSWRRSRSAGCRRRTDVARAALYLASDDAEFITGVEFPVDGGRTI